MGFYATGAAPQMPERIQSRRNAFPQATLGTCLLLSSSLPTYLVTLQEIKLAALTEEGGFKQSTLPSRLPRLGARTAPWMS